MSNILDTLAQHARARVEKSKAEKPLEEVMAQALSMEADTNPETGYPFDRAIAAPGMSFICECKKASPSKGLIAPEFPYLEIAAEYEAAGAAAISCLTEPDFFMGSTRYLKEIAAKVSIPVLRKDFIVDPYMIYEAKILGASAVLLICAILSDDQMQEYGAVARSLGLSVLAEAHDAEEVRRAIRVEGAVIGVNNRDLKDFTVDIGNSVRYRGMIPEDRLYVSESGIKTAADVGVLYRNGTNAVLIGETLMRSTDKKAMLEQLRSGCR